MSNLIVQGLWWEGLGEMERLSIRSYLAHGHEFHLYSYGPVWGYPKGTIIKDAREIVPFSDKDRFWHLAQFSDWFRYNLLLKCGGWWVDLDTICLRPFDFPDDIVLTQEDFRRRKPWVTNAYMKIPAQHPILQWIIKTAKRTEVGTAPNSSEEYIAIGPALVTKAAIRFRTKIQPSRLFNYFNSFENPSWLELFKVPAFELPADAYAIHLYRNTWRNEKRYHLVNEPPRGSLWEKLMKRYPPKVLIACSSCWRDVNNGGNQAIRDTWGKDLPPNWDLRFFVGGQNTQAPLTHDFVHSPDTMAGELHPHTAKQYEIDDPATLKDDEVFLPDTPDGYMGLSWKTRDSLQWALDYGYDYIFRIFVDTYVIVERLAESGFLGRDAIGWMWDCESCPAHPGVMHKSPLGGTGYWTSAHAAQVIVDAPIMHWAEDAHVGAALFNAGMEWEHDGRYPFDPNDDVKFWRDRITLHLGDRHEKWGPELMYRAHGQVQRMLSRHDYKRRQCYSDQFPPLSTAKPVILISSCVRDRLNGNQEAIRETWGENSAIPYFFCIGDMAPTADDEIELDCPDNYFSLCLKTQASLKWALEQGYTHMIRAFTDTYIDTERLLAAEYANDDYVGNVCTAFKFPFLHGGPGYILSAKAAQIVVASDPGDHWKLEDQWVGWLMRENGIEYIHDPRFSMGRSYTHRELKPLADNDIISVHLSSQRGQYDKRSMYRTHRHRTRPSR